MVNGNVPLLRFARPDNGSRPVNTVNNGAKGKSLFTWDMGTVVVKIGSSSVAHENEKGELTGVDYGHLGDNLMEGVVGLRKRGYKVVLVSSGAVAVGQARKKILIRPKDPDELSCLANVGQPILMHVYNDLLTATDFDVAQVLVQRSSFHNEVERSKLLRICIKHLIDGDLIVANENDALVSTEMTYGDNDFIASLFAVLLNAKYLITLTDKGGILTADPKVDPKAKLILQIGDVTKKIFAGIGTNGSHGSSGGPLSKTFAADLARRHGVQSCIASIREAHNLVDIIEGRNMNRSWFDLKHDGDVDFDIGIDRLCEVIDKFVANPPKTFAEYSSLMNDFLLSRNLAPSVQRLQL